jgi:putative phosphoribosyl transferase
MKIGGAHRKNGKMESMRNSVPARWRAQRVEAVAVKLPFRDRSEAGRLLGIELAAREPATNVIIVALDRGGVPVGAEVAERLNAPLDILVVRKLGVPWQPELAMGAIAGGVRVLDRRIIRDFDISREEVAVVVAREALEIERRETIYRNGRPAFDLGGRAVVLVDDGLATGSTMVAAARHVRSFHPQKLIVAVPVGSSEACSRLSKEADNCVCLALPTSFLAVSQWYADFRQVTDAEVQELLKRRHALFESA